jgi:hypothetical protein
MHRDQQPSSQLHMQHRQQEEQQSYYEQQLGKLQARCPKQQRCSLSSSKSKTRCNGISSSRAPSSLCLAPSKQSHPWEGDHVAALAEGFDHWRDCSVNWLVGDLKLSHGFPHSPPVATETL